METLRELVVVIIGLTIILSLALPFVFLVKIVRGASLGEAGRFCLHGLGICMAVSVIFVVGVSGLSALTGTGGDSEVERACGPLGGEVQEIELPDGTTTTMCIVN